MFYFTIRRFNCTFDRFVPCILIRNHHTQSFPGVPVIWYKYQNELVKDGGVEAFVAQVSVSFPGREFFTKVVKNIRWRCQSFFLDHTSMRKHPWIGFVMRKRQAFFHHKAFSSPRVNYCTGKRWSFFFFSFKMPWVYHPCVSASTQLFEWFQKLFSILERCVQSTKALGYLFLYHFFKRAAGNTSYFVQHFFQSQALDIQSFFFRIWRPHLVFFFSSNLSSYGENICWADSWASFSWVKWKNTPFKRVICHSLFSLAKLNTHHQEFLTTGHYFAMMWWAQLAWAT